jgi:dihydrofolate synthase/folylpolyglutamate synthase
LQQAALLPHQVWKLGVDLLSDDRAPDVVVSGPQHRCVSVRPSLAGAHQRTNAAIATGLAWMLRAPDDDAPSLAIEDVAIAKGIANTDWPGRLETIASKDGVVLLDGAHNEEGVRALAAHLDSLTHPPEKRALIFGAMASKAWGNMVRELLARFGHRFYVEPKVLGRDAVNIWHLVDIDARGVPIDSVREALARAREAVGLDGIVVVAGSLYLVGQVRSLLLAIPSDETIGM